MTHRRSTRSAAARPNPLNWLNRTAVATVLLAATALTRAAAESQPPAGPAARQPELNLEASAGPLAGLPVAEFPLFDGYDLLLERARRQVLPEQRVHHDDDGDEEEVQNRRLDNFLQTKNRASDDASRSGYDSRGIRVVRETFYIPQEQLGPGGGRLGRAEPSPHDQGSNAAAAGSQPASAPASTTPADFRQTVGKLRFLRPLFTYAVHHPVRFVVSYLISPLLSLAGTLVVELAYLVLLAFSPATYLASTLVGTPLVATWRVVASLAPVLYALAGAIIIGAGLGALGGVIAARTTRHAVDVTVDATQRGLRWLGVLPKLEGRGRLEEDEEEDVDDTGEGVYGERYAQLSSEAERVARAVSESVSESVSEEEEEEANDRLEEAAFASRKEEDEGERLRADAAAKARANRIEALRHRVKLEGAGPPVLV
ncbi:hypothetical protein JCM3774_004725 [Rhodotorula dairenensis]